jgi:hypothetical protein
MIEVLKLLFSALVLTCIGIASYGADDAKPVKVREIAKGGFSGMQQPGQLVITNQQQWQKVWAQHSAGRTAQPLPEVNFEKETVVFVAMGQKRTGGYTVKIDSAEKSGDKTIVHVSTKSPGKGAMTTQVITAPFAAAAIDGKGKVEIVVEPGKPAAKRETQ